MTRRLSLFLVVTFITGIIYSFGCGGDGGGGETPPPPPPPKLDKIIWAQEVPKDFVPAAETAPAEGAEAAKPAGEGEKKVKPAKSTGPTVLEEGNLNKVTAFFASDTDGTRTVRLTPNITSFLLGGYSGIAPNGDLWYMTEVGLFKTNVTEEAPKARPVASTQKLFTKFSDFEPALYWSENFIDAAKNHKIRTEMKSYFNEVGNLFKPMQTNIYFVPKGDGSGDYFTLLLFDVYYFKGGVNDVAKLWRRCDSNLENCEPIVPFITATSDASGFLSAAEGETPPTYDISGESFDSESGRLYYDIGIGKPGSFYRKFEVEYDALTKEHAVFEKDLIYPVGNLSPLPEYIPEYIPENCKLYQEELDLPFTEDDCNYTWKNAAEQSDLKKKVVACMEEKVSKIKVPIRCSPKKAITDYLSSKEKLTGLLTLAPSGSPKEMANIDANILIQFDTKDYYSATCYSTPNVCKPSSSVFKKLSEDYVYDEQNPPKEGDYIPVKIRLENVSADGNSPYMIFKGVIKDGNEIRNALYLLNLSNGSFSQIDKDDSNTTVALAGTAKTETGPVFLYMKNRSGSGSGEAGFRAIYTYDPTSTGPVALTGFVPSEVYPVSFGSFVNGSQKRSLGISYDRKLAFMKVKDDIGRENTYVKKLIVEGEGTEAAKGKKGLKEEGTSEAAATGPLGEGWTLAYSEAVQDKAINIGLEYQIGDQLVWLCNKDGFKKPCLNKLGEALNCFTGPYREADVTMIAAAQGVAQATLPEGAVMVDVSNLTLDLKAQFACGGGNPDGYCADPRQMCIKKGETPACVDMFNCSPGNPSGACLEQGKVCKDGNCVAIEPPPVIECYSNNDCQYGYECIGNFCVHINECPKGYIDCEKFHVCSNGYCLYMPTQECQVTGQCGSSNDFYCDSNLRYCVPVVTNAKLVASNPKFLTAACTDFSCPFCTNFALYQYDFKATWTSKDNTDNQQFKGFYGEFLKGDTKFEGFSNLKCGNDNICEYTIPGVSICFGGILQGCYGLPPKCTINWNSKEYKFRVVPQFGTDNVGSFVTSPVITVTKPQ